MSLTDLFSEWRSSLTVDEISLDLRFVKIKFSNEEFLAFSEIADELERIVNRAFVEAGVMHIDLTKENPNDSIRSLFKVADYLDEKVTDLEEKLHAKEKGLIRILEQLRSEMVVHAKKIAATKAQIDAGNAGEFESDYRVRTSDWLPAPLREMRLATYPSIRALIDLLPEDRPSKQRALNVWYEGRKILTEREKDEAVPLWSRN